MKHFLTITVSRSGETLYCKRFALNGNYIIGRKSEKCYEIFLAFANQPTTVIALPQTQYLSGFHCVLYEDLPNYYIIDGWGQHKSSNGVYLNGTRVEFAALNNGDVVNLGTAEVELKYESERHISDSEKETLSSVL